MHLELDICNSVRCILHAMKTWSSHYNDAIIWNRSLHTCDETIFHHSLCTFVLFSSATSSLNSIETVRIWIIDSVHSIPLKKRRMWLVWYKRNFTQFDEKNVLPKHNNNKIMVSNTHNNKQIGLPLKIRKYEKYLQFSYDFADYSWPTISSSLRRISCFQLIKILLNIRMPILLLKSA